MNDFLIKFFIIFIIFVNNNKIKTPSKVLSSNKLSQDNNSKIQDKINDSEFYNPVYPTLEEVLDMIDKRERRENKIPEGRFQADTCPSSN